MIGCFTSHPRKLEIEKFECFLMGNEHQGRRFGRGMESRGVRTKKKGRGNQRLEDSRARGQRRGWESDESGNYGKWRETCEESSVRSGSREGEFLGEDVEEGL
jgi:hypothetical protein